MKTPSENQTMFLAVIGFIGFTGCLAVFLKVSVFTYVDFWEVLLRVLETVLGGIVFGFCAILGVDIYERKVRKKIFEDDNDSKNKAA